MMHVFKLALLLIMLIMVPRLAKIVWRTASFVRARQIVISVLKATVLVRENVWMMPL